MVVNRVLSPEDWVDAAHRIFSTAGLDAVRVEVVARELGATKGSFYWHFSDRRALQDAVLQRWEEEDAALAAAVGDPAGGSPQERVASLFGRVTASAAQWVGEALLYGRADDPRSATVVERVTRARLSALAGLLRELGLAPEEAERRAVVALAAAVGHQQLALGAPGAVTGVGGDPAALTAALAAMVTAPSARG